MLSDLLRLGGHPDPEASEASVEPTPVPQSPCKEGPQTSHPGDAGWPRTGRGWLSPPAPSRGDLGRPGWRVQARSVLEGVPWEGSLLVTHR